MQHKCKENVINIKVVHTTIVVVHEWGVKYRCAPPELVKKTREQVELEKAEVQMLIQRNKQLNSFITNIQESYA